MSTILEKLDEVERRLPIGNTFHFSELKPVRLNQCAFIDFSNSSKGETLLNFSCHGCLAVKYANHTLRRRTVSYKERRGHPSLKMNKTRSFVIFG